MRKRSIPTEMYKIFELLKHIPSKSRQVIIRVDQGLGVAYRDGTSNQTWLTEITPPNYSLMLEEPQFPQTVKSLQEKVVNTHSVHPLLFSRGRGGDPLQNFQKEGLNRISIFGEDCYERGERVIFFWEGLQFLHKK